MAHLALRGPGRSTSAEKHQVLLQIRQIWSVLSRYRHLATVSCRVQRGVEWPNPWASAAVGLIWSCRSGIALRMRCDAISSRYGDRFARMAGAAGLEINPATGTARGRSLACDLLADQRPIGCLRSRLATSHRVTGIQTCLAGRRPRHAQTLWSSWKVVAAMFARLGPAAAQDPALGASQDPGFMWQWLKLEFGQTLLMGVRAKEPSARTGETFGNYPILPPLEATSTGFLVVINGV